MTDLQAFSSTITGSIQAAKSAAASPDFAQPEFFKTVLLAYFEMIPNEWDSKGKQYFVGSATPSLEEVAKVLNEDIRHTAANNDRCTIYQLLLRLAIVVYGIESNMMRSSGPLNGISGR